MLSSSYVRRAASAFLVLAAAVTVARAASAAQTSTAAAPGLDDAMVAKVRANLKEIATRRCVPLASPTSCAGVHVALS